MSDCEHISNNILLIVLLQNLAPQRLLSIQPRILIQRLAQTQLKRKYVCSTLMSDANYLRSHIFSTITGNFSNGISTSWSCPAHTCQADVSTSPTQIYVKIIV
jgi:hypothetical protein